MSNKEDFYVDSMTLQGGGNGILPFNGSPVPRWKKG